MATTKRDLVWPASIHRFLGCFGVFLRFQNHSKRSDLVNIRSLTSVAGPSSGRDQCGVGRVFVSGFVGPPFRIGSGREVFWAACSLIVSSFPSVITPA